jgi:hypothetical protein
MVTIDDVRSFAMGAMAAPKWVAGAYVDEVSPR